MLALWSHPAPAEIGARSPAQGEAGEVMADDDEIRSAGQFVGGRATLSSEIEDSARDIARLCEAKLKNPNEPAITEKIVAEMDRLRRLVDAVKTFG
jgi:hypothetical protein